MATKNVTLGPTPLERATTAAATARTNATNATTVPALRAEVERLAQAILDLVADRRR